MRGAGSWSTYCSAQITRSHYRGLNRGVSSDSLFFLCKDDLGGIEKGLDDVGSLDAEVPVRRLSRKPSW